jgi:lipase chaperone LimK
MVKKKQEALPGMEDMAQIPELDEAATEYAAIRDERMKLTGEEVEKRSELHELMRKHEKMKYSYEGISIERIPGEESIKVKVRKEKSDEEAA